MLTDSGAPGPKVSVCVVTYNQSHYIQRCLDSVYAQGAPFEFEVIIGDDASNDGTAAIVREYAARFPDQTRVIIQPTNVGPVPNYFTVHDAARGEYVAHIDGDDLMAPGKIWLQAQFLDEHPECAMVGHDVEILDESGRDVLAHSFTDRLIPEVTDITHLVERGCFFAHSSKMYRRGAAGEVDRSAAIVDLYLHMHHASAGKVGYIDRVLGSYRRNSESISNVRSRYFVEMLEGRLAAYDLARRLGVSADLVGQKATEFKYVSAMHSIRNGGPAVFRRFIRIGEADQPYVTFRHRAMALLAKVPIVAEAAVWAFDLTKVRRR